MQKKIDLILVPTDFSGLSCEAFSWATLLAQQFNAKILIVHVISERDAVDMTAQPGNPWENVLEREDKAMIENFQNCLISDFRQEVETDTLVEVGPADEKLIDAAKKNNADLIVMATHGRTGLSHALMGSVAEKVLRQAPCPVFTVRPKGE
ncbi:MAG: universal stress protein [Desulfobacterales bacterium]|jgi:nucleotide-binding universal stress UspA family protein